MTINKSDIINVIKTFNLIKTASSNELSNICGKLRTEIDASFIFPDSSRQFKHSDYVSRVCKRFNEHKILYMLILELMEYSSTLKHASKDTLFINALETFIFDWTKFELQFNEPDYKYIFWLMHTCITNMAGNNDSNFVNKVLITTPYNYNLTLKDLENA